MPETMIGKNAESELGFPQGRPMALAVAGRGRPLRQTIEVAMDRLDQKRRQIAEVLHEIGEHRPGAPLLVRQVMTQNPITISGDACILDLVQLFHAKEFRHPLVTDHDGNLIGVVSDRDVIRCFGPGKYPQENLLKSITTAEIMSTDLVTTSPDAPLEGALESLFGYGINCLPVVSGATLVGILTSTDLYLVLETLLAGVRESGKSPAPARAFAR